MALMKIAGIAIQKIKRLKNHHASSALRQFVVMPHAHKPTNTVQPAVNSKNKSQEGIDGNA
jgi:hypothetical protein